MSGDYPAGAKDNSNAPYNKLPCLAECEGGFIFNEDENEYEECTICNGSGVLDDESVNDAYESFKEDTRD